MIKKVDVDHSGTLDFDEFSNLTSHIRHERDPFKDLSLCWRVLGIVVESISRFKKAFVKFCFKIRLAEGQCRLAK